MQNVSACPPRPSEPSRTISLAGAGPNGHAAGAVTSRREYGRNGSASAAISHRGGPFTAMTARRPNKPADSARLSWRGSANHDQRRIRTAWHWTAGSASFAEELRLIARGAAIGGDQDFVVLALHRAPRSAIRSDHSDARAGRACRTFFTLPPCRAGRSR